MKITNIQFYEDDGKYPACMVVHWTDDYKWFGEVTIAKGEVGLEISSEKMGKKFVKELLCKLVDDAELVE